MADAKEVYATHVEDDVQKTGAIKEANVASVALGMEIQEVYSNLLANDV